MQAAKARGVKLGDRRSADANKAAAAARDAVLEPALKETGAHVCAWSEAGEIERRGLGKVSYKLVQRARVRLGKLASSRELTMVLELGLDGIAIENFQHRRAGDMPPAAAR